MFKKIITFAAGIAVGILGVFTYDTFKPKDRSTPPVVITDDIEYRIQQIGELATAEFVYTITQTADKKAFEVFNISIPFTSSRIVYSYSGTIKAGIDFSEIKAVTEGETIHITLPQSTILSNDLDHDSLTVYDEKNSIFNRFSFSDMNASQADLKKTAEETAAEKGLLETADANAREIIEKTISSMYGNGEYTVVFD
ncbi:MAG: DUF4230 domain-containing protein [Solobacterium sp.]|nr:DUF4230 domain-containing protein [Solobacterium sp.]